MKPRNAKNYLLLCLIAIALSLPAFGAGQDKNPASWTKKDLEQAIARAKIADDHARIAQYYWFEASRLAGESTQHTAFAKMYGSRTGRHCCWLGAQYAKQARQERRLAEIHETMAKSPARVRKSMVRR